MLLFFQTLRVKPRPSPSPSHFPTPFAEPLFQPLSQPLSRDLVRPLLFIAVPLSGPDSALSAVPVEASAQSSMPQPRRQFEDR
jgi:hypothetical protein